VSAALTLARVRHASLRHTHVVVGSLLSQKFREAAQNTCERGGRAAPTAQSTAKSAVTSGAGPANRAFCGVASSTHPARISEGMSSILSHLRTGCV
jgi:hypothetical protein